MFCCSSVWLFQRCFISTVFSFALEVERRICAAMFLYTFLNVSIRFCICLNVSMYTYIYVLLVFVYVSICFYMFRYICIRCYWGALLGYWRRAGRGEADRRLEIRSVERACRKGTNQMGSALMGSLQMICVLTGTFLGYSP